MLQGKIVLHKQPQPSSSSNCSKIYTSLLNINDLKMKDYWTGVVGLRVPSSSNPLRNSASSQRFFRLKLKRGPLEVRLELSKAQPTFSCQIGWWQFAPRSKDRSIRRCNNESESEAGFELSLRARGCEPCVEEGSGG